MKTIIILLIVLIVFSRCNKDEKIDAIINYYITTNTDTIYQNISFDVNFLRAYRQQNNEIRSVNIAPTRVSFDLSLPERVFLGSSNIEPGKITGYDYSFGNFRLVKGEDTISLIQLSSMTSFIDFEMSPSEGQVLDITFIMDVQSSLVIDSAGQNWIRPQITIEN